MTLAGVFALLRSFRNEAGHPTGVAIGRAQCYANLMVFPSYVRKVSGLFDSRL